MLTLIQHTLTHPELCECDSEVLRGLDQLNANAAHQSDARIRPQRQRRPKQCG